jgi:hypothetical protein
MSLYNRDYSDAIRVALAQEHLVPERLFLARNLTPHQRLLPRQDLWYLGVDHLPSGTTLDPAGFSRCGSGLTLGMGRKTHGLTAQRERPPRRALWTFHFGDPSFLHGSGDQRNAAHKRTLVRWRFLHACTNRITRWSPFEPVVDCRGLRWLGCYRLVGSQRWRSRKQRVARGRGCHSALSGPWDVQ